MQFTEHKNFYCPSKEEMNFKKYFPKRNETVHIHEHIWSLGIT